MIPLKNHQVSGFRFQSGLVLLRVFRELREYRTHREMKEGTDYV